MKLTDIPGRITERADQVLLGLSHSKQSIPTLLKQTLQRIENNPNDIVGRVSRQVLERAETVRKQLIEKAETSNSPAARWVPDWLKDITFVRAAAEAALGAEVSAASVEVKPARARASETAKKSGAKKPAAKKTATKTRAKKV